ncbi:hypothetical protein ACFB49_05710 [Sphingomonas sp. DBB INV C78]|uniref:hypothetical protein n=1 Tax=Sphingomonas sp. DBB INV C78 TaxID=3349434 RepID=UPI0036D28B10
MADLTSCMPNMLRHAGWWEGEYRVIERDGTLTEHHHMRTFCEFPTAGPYAYLQHNWLRWPDGRTLERAFGATFRDGRLWWNTERLEGYGHEIEGGIVMLNLVHKSEAALRFTEMIELSEDGQNRARTWQWFRNGTPVRRTLCDEWRTG